jgi:hypothetical protein
MSSPLTRVRWRDEEPAVVVHRNAEENRPWYSTPILGSVLTPETALVLATFGSPALVGFLCIGRESAAVVAVFTAAAVVPFVASLVALVNLVIMCFFAKKTEDDALTVSAILIVPLARVLSWALLHMAVWTWDRDGWYHVETLPTFTVWLRFLADCFNLVPDHDAVSTLAHIASGLFQYEFNLVLVPVILAASVSVALEHAKA